MLTAVQGGDLNKVKDFIGRGASIEAKDEDEYGWTSLHLAASQGYLEVTKFLVGKGTNINDEDKNGKTPQDIAIDQKHDSVAVYLQQTQSGLNEQLLVAVRGNDLNKVKDLVSKGASVDTKDSNGWTSLHYAARRGCLKAAEFLTDKGANIRAKDKDGQIPLCVAVQYDRPGIINFLLGRGTNIEASDFHDNTVLKLAYCIKGLMDKTNNNVQSDFQELKSKLPESVKNLVFASQVCIRNVEYGRYLYSPNSHSDFQFDNDRRYVFTWPSKLGNDGKWKVELDGDNVYLKNVAYGRYLYSPNSDSIALFTIVQTDHNTLLAYI